MTGRRFCPGAVPVRLIVQSDKLIALDVYSWFESRFSPVKTALLVKKPKLTWRPERCL